MPLVSFIRIEFASWSHFLNERTVRMHNERLDRNQRVKNLLFFLFFVVDFFFIVSLLLHSCHIKRTYIKLFQITISCVRFFFRFQHNVYCHRLLCNITYCIDITHTSNAKIDFDTLFSLLLLIWFQKRSKFIASVFCDGFLFREHQNRMHRADKLWHKPA